MAKKRSWFNLVKRLFMSEAKSNAEKKSKRWRWVFGRLKLQQYPSLAAPQRTLSEAREEQNKHALTVAIATAAAAEAAVAAAHAAAEVVRLTATSQSYQLFEKGNQNLAAIKIQTAFRAHLAMKAFRALKALVRLQAMVRGRIVRRQAITTLKCLPSIANTKSQVHERRVVTVDESCKVRDKQEFLRLQKELQEEETTLECNSQRNWNYSMFTKEDMEATRVRKQEAIIKRERMKKYSFSNQERRNVQMPEESQPNNENGKPSCRLEQWANMEAYKKKELESLKSTVHSYPTTGEVYGTTQLKLRNSLKQYLIEGLNSPSSLSRRSFSHAKQNSIEDDNSFPNSPVFPTYMAATVSAKAKARSMSTPKQRLGFQDTFSYHSSPYNNRLSSCSSFNGEETSSNGKRSGSQTLSRYL